MVDRIDMHGANQGNIIGHCSDVGHERRDLHPALAVLLELKGRSHALEHRLSGRHAGDALAPSDTRRQLLAGHLLELGLGVEKIEVRGRTRLEEVDDPLGLRR